MIIPFRRPPTPSAQSQSPPASRAEDLAKAESAADALAQMLRHAYTDRHNRIHAPTIVGGAAALTGEFALRAAGLPLSIPDEHYPTEWSPNAGPRLRGAVREIALRYWLTPRQTALALGMATGNLIHQGKDLLPPKIAFRLAVEVMFATAKMAPLTDRIQ
jgi:hypothetical protein